MLSLFKTAVAALLLAPAALALPNPNAHGLQPFFYKGFDLSSLHILEEGNVTYKDTARYNETRPAEDILGDGGMNTVRLRFASKPYRSESMYLTETTEFGSTPSQANTISHTP